MSEVEIVVLPRESMTMKAFCARAPRRSIALDGLINDVGPQWIEESLHVNYDHHVGVVREATMSTSMQAFFGIKGGTTRRFRQDRLRSGDTRLMSLWINDPDQDTALATWLLLRHTSFEGVQSHPIINRLLTLTDRWDITGGAFPAALDDNIVETHAWVFDPYTALRVSGALAQADADVMRHCLDAVHQRLNLVLMGQCERKALRRDVTVLFDSPHGYKILDETGGNEARYLLFSQGMDAFVSRVATRSDGRHVYSIGRRSQAIDFPVQALYAALNNAEDEVVDPVQSIYPHARWGGSTIIGGSPRECGSRLSWQEVRDVIERHLAPDGKALLDLAQQLERQP